MKHRVEVEVERGPLGLPRWVARCLCDWSVAFVATPGVDGEWQAFMEGVAHVEGPAGGPGGSVCSSWHWEGF